MKGISKWKELPQLKDEEKVRKCNKFQATLAKIGNKQSIISFRVLRKFESDGTESKRCCIQNLIYKTMSDHKRMFQSWETFTINQKQNLKCYACLHLFEITNNLIQNNLSAFMRTTEFDLKKKVIEKFLLKFNKTLVNLLKRWNE